MADGGPADGSAAPVYRFKVRKTRPGGNVYVAAPNQHHVCKVATNNTGSTVAGTGTPGGYSSGSGAANNAQIHSLSDVASGQRGQSLHRWGRSGDTPVHGD